MLEVRRTPPPPSHMSFAEAPLMLKHRCGCLGLSHVTKGVLAEDRGYGKVLELSTVGGGGWGVCSPPLSPRIFLAWNRGKGAERGVNYEGNGNEVVVN